MHTALPIETPSSSGRFVAYHPAAAFDDSNTTAAYLRHWAASDLQCTLANVIYEHPYYVLAGCGEQMYFACNDDYIVTDLQCVRHYEAEASGVLAVLAERRNARIATQPQ